MKPLLNAVDKALRSKTVWGVVIVQCAALAAGGPITAAAVAKALGVVITTAGGRDALDKAAQLVAASLSSGPMT